MLTTTRRDTRDNLGKNKKTDPQSHSRTVTVARIGTQGSLIPKPELDSLEVGGRGVIVTAVFLHAHQVSVGPHLLLGGVCSRVGAGERV